MGFQEERGDQVAIRPCPLTVPGWKSFPEQQAPALSTAVILLLCLIPLPALPAVACSEERSLREERGFLLEPDAELAAAEVACRRGRGNLSTKHDQLAEIERIAGQQPKEVAKLIETWLHRGIRRVGQWREAD